MNSPIEQQPSASSTFPIALSASVFAAVFLLVMLIAATVTFVQPKMYSGIARIKTEPERLPLELFQRQGQTGCDPYFLQTQSEIIRSKKILYPVIQRYNLCKRWATGGDKLPVEYVLHLLKRNLFVQRYRDTSLIEICVSDQDPVLAADLANEIARTFEVDRLSVKHEQTKKGLLTVQEELAAQLRKVNDAQEKVDKLRKDLNVPIFCTVKIDNLTLQQLESQLITARVELVGRETRLKELQKLPHNQSDARMDAIMSDYEVNYRMAQTRVTELEKQLDNLKKSKRLMDSAEMLPFRNAQREEESEAKLYEVLKQRLQQIVIERQVPRSPVELIDLAEPALTPVRPNWTLNLGLGAITGVVVGFFFAVLTGYGIYLARVKQAHQTHIPQ